MGNQNPQYLQYLNFSPISPDHRTNVSELLYEREEHVTVKDI